MRNIFKLGAAGLAVLLLVSFAFANVFIVDEGDRVLIVRLGKMDRVLEPGLHLKTPFVEDRVTFSVRVQRVQYASIDSYTNDNQVVTSDLLLAYHIDPAAIQQIYALYGKDFEQKLMKELTIGSFRAVMGKVNTVTLASERDEVSDRTLANLRNVLAPYGIIADETRLLSIEFSKQFEAKIEKAAEEKAAVERAVQTARLREQEALALVTKAKGEAEAKRLAAEAEAYQITQVAKAEADRIRFAGDAEAERLRDRAAAIRENPQLIALLQAEAMLKWDGNLPERMYPSSALPILNLEPGQGQ